jgi:hypothetical protein
MRQSYQGLAPTNYRRPFQKTEARSAVPNFQIVQPLRSHITEARSNSSSRSTASLRSNRLKPELVQKSWTDLEGEVARFENSQDVEVNVHNEPAC